MHDLESLRVSLSNLYDKFGQTDNYKVWLMGNLATILVGLVVHQGLPFPYNTLGIGIAILGLWGLVKQVVRA